MGGGDGKGRRRPFGDAGVASNAQARAEAEGRALRLAAEHGGLRRGDPGVPAWPVLRRLLADGRLEKTGPWYHLPGAVPPQTGEQTCAVCGEAFVSRQPQQRVCKRRPGCLLVPRSGQVRGARSAPRQGGAPPALALPRTQAEQRAIVEAIRAEEPEAHERPRHRADCAPGGALHHRPCPYVGCRYNLFLDVRASGAIAFPHGPDLDGLRVSCALDVAGDGEHSIDEVGQLLGGISRQSAELIEREARARVVRHVRRLVVLGDDGLVPDREVSAPHLHATEGE